MQTYYGKEKQQEVVLKNQIIIKILIVFSITFFFNIKASLGGNKVKIMVF